MVALCCSVLIVTGYLLYDLRDTLLRPVSTYVHWAVGLAGPLVLVLHRARLPGKPQESRPMSWQSPQFTPSVQRSSVVGGQAMTKTMMLIGASGLAIMSSGAAQAGTLWMGNLNGAQENPPTGVPYTGTGFLILNDAETSAVVSVTHNVPTAIITDGHIHRAPAGVNGPVIFPFPRVNGLAGISPVGPLTWAIPSAEVVNLKAERLYFNIHTQQNPGGSIRGQIRAALLSTSATDASQLAVANALDVSAGFTPDLDQLLMNAAMASGEARTQVLNDLSNRTAYSQTRHAAETMVDFQETLFDHTQDVRQSPAEGFGLFAAAGESFGERDGEVGQAGSKISRPWLMAGFDIGSGGFTGGLAVAYAKGEDKFRGGAGGTDVETTSVHGFVSMGERVILTGVAGYGWNTFDTRRGLASLGSTAAASPDGEVWSLGAKVSAPFAAGNTMSISPYGQIDMQHASVDAYSETGVGSAGLVVPKRTLERTSLEAGAALTAPLSSQGGGLSARLQAGWRYRLQGDSEDFATSLVGSPVAFLTDVASSSRSAAHLRASITGNLSTNLSVAASYRALVGSRDSLQAVELRLTLRM
jgi:outer membrane autotransporter protein